MQNLCVQLPADVHSGAVLSLVCAPLDKHAEARKPSSLSPRHRPPPCIPRVVQGRGTQRFLACLSQLYLVPSLVSIGLQPGKQNQSVYLKQGFGDFPGGAVVKNLPANAGDTGSSPGPGRCHVPRSSQARAPQLLSLCATTTEAHVPRARAPQRERPPQ